MRKITLTIGERVAVIEDNKIINGTIVNIFSEISNPIVVVKTENGSCIKTPIEKVAKLSEERSEEKSEDPIQEVKQKTEITITPEEFKEISAKIVFDEMKKLGSDGLMLGMAFTILTAKLHKALFVGEADND